MNTDPRWRWCLPWSLPGRFQPDDLPQAWNLKRESPVLFPDKLRLARLHKANCPPYFCDNPRVREILLLPNYLPNGNKLNYGFRRGKVTAMKRTWTWNDRDHEL